MSQVITKRIRISRRALLQGVTASGARIVVGLPPLVAMFNSHGTAYAAGTRTAGSDKPIESRFVLWFNGNGIPERYWIPSEEGRDFRITPCLSPLAPFRSDVHVLSGLDNAASGGQGNGHTNSMSGLMTGTRFTGRGASGPSIDQVIASKLGGDSRFRSLQIGVSQESFGESMQRNMSWAGYERALPPEMIPHRLFDRLFGAREEGWVNRKRSILDTVRQDATALKKKLPTDDQARVEEFAYLVAKLKSVPEGDGTLFDHCCLAYVHEHAEANPHKNSGLAMILAGGIGRLAKGSHTRITGTVGDIYLTVADEVLQAGLGKFPTAT